VTILLKNSSSPWPTLLAERPCLHCHSSKENDTIKVKLRSRDHSSTNSKHACAEGSVTNLKRCYGESGDNFLLTYVFPKINCRRGRIRIEIRKYVVRDAIEVKLDSNVMGSWCLGLR
jgi:hypothetical protein